MAVLAGLLNRIAPFDTVQEMDRAREDRYWDAVACAMESSEDDRRAFGACYLLGYSVEMLLKVAYFRLLEIRPFVDLKEEINTARQDMRTFKLGRNLHDLVGWYSLVQQARIGRADLPPLASEISSGFEGYVTKVAANWSELLRYRKSVGAVAEFHEVLGAVEWMRANQHYLWS